MAEKRDDAKEQQRRGFSGLSDLVSKIDVTPASAEKVQPQPKPSEPTEPATNHALPPPSASSRPADSSPTPPAPPSSSSVGKWFLGIFGLLVVFGILGNLGNRSSSPYSGPSKSAPASDRTSSAGSGADRGPEESKPPIATQAVLTVPQISYCLAEEIRLDGAERAVDRYNDWDVALFNNLINDYNSRCSSFRYRSGALERARRAVEPFRSQLLLAGARKFERAPAVSYPENTPPSAPSPDPTVRSIQQKLSQLGYTPGPADGLMGGNTRRAILAYQEASGMPQDGLPTELLVARLDLAIQSGRAAPPPAASPRESVATHRPARAVPAPSPANSTSRHGGNGLKCGPGYYQFANECRQLQIPENAGLNYLGDGWKCNSGYYRVGDGCRKVEVPPNASLNILGDGWKCNPGYYRAGAGCQQVQIPPNASLNILGDGWKCNPGYYRAGESCLAVQIPLNASLNILGDGWKCNAGYYRAGAGCQQVEIPPNAALNILGDGWKCNHGYFKAGNQCQPVQVPQNASLNILGDGWACNRGYRRVGSRCE